MKTCRGCGVEKSLDLYYNDKKSKDGKCWRCKECMNVVTYRNFQKKRKTRPDWSTEEGLKICRKCLDKKPISEFNVHHGKTNTKDKLRNECRECQKAHAKEHYKTIKDECNTKRRDLKHDPIERQKRHHQHIKRKFGLSREDYERMLTSQNGKCMICGTDKPGINGNALKNYAIDHDHATGKIRSLLCANCNQGLGSFQDSPDLLRKAARYLESFT